MCLNTQAASGRQGGARDTAGMAGATQMQGDLWKGWQAGTEFCGSGSEETSRVRRHQYGKHPGEDLSQAACLSWGSGQSGLWSISRNSRLANPGSYGRLNSVTSAGRAMWGDAIWEASAGGHKQLNKGASLANQGDVLLDPLHVPMYFYFLYITPPYSLKHIHLDLGGATPKLLLWTLTYFFQQKHCS